MNKRLVIWISVGAGVLLICVTLAFLLWDLGGPGSWPVYMVTEPTVSPSRDRIAFTVCRRGKRRHQLDVRLAVLSLQTRKVLNTGAEISARGFASTWSEDGTSLVFISGAYPRHWGLDIINIETGVVTRVSEPSCWTPKFSPEGALLGFVRDDDLVVLNMTSRQETVVARNVNHWHWCWASGGREVFYVRDKEILSSQVGPGATERLLCTEASTEPYDSAEYLTPSPDGSRLGFYRSADDSFNALDLKTGRAVALFHCDHYFMSFLWIPSGVVYLDACEGERREFARLMLYDVSSGESREVAAGPFAAIRWLGGKDILVKVGNMELWRYNLDSGNGERVLSIEDLGTPRKPSARGLRPPSIPQKPGR